MTTVFGAFPVMFMIVAAVIGVGGIVGLVKGVARLRGSASLREDGRETTGTVVDSQMESRGAGDNRFMVFRPVVRFRTQEGQEVTAVGPNASRRSFVKDSTVPLRYHPDRPAEIEIVTGEGSGSGAWAMIAGGLLAAVAGLFFVVVGWHWNVT
ncbi:DUF3592 domain-containing protein [Hamadaea sp. NPDC050747]|uniref:DUF3592 domain-containing protein n=1 Tax=Hamadaea sp. NPDC050747 TaxID=3155789 RepID=UPI0033D7E871